MDRFQDENARLTHELLRWDPLFHHQFTSKLIAITRRRSGYTAIVANQHFPHNTVCIRWYSMALKSVLLFKTCAYDTLCAAATAIGIYIPATITVITKSRAHACAHILAG
jgi:hypothetical protein